MTLKQVIDSLDDAPIKEGIVSNLLNRQKIKRDAQKATREAMTQMDTEREEKRRKNKEEDERYYNSLGDKELERYKNYLRKQGVI